MSERFYSLTLCFLAAASMVVLLYWMGLAERSTLMLLLGTHFAAASIARFDLFKSAFHARPATGARHYWWSSSQRK